jgi:hypothetical protein
MHIKGQPPIWMQSTPIAAKPLSPPPEDAEPPAREEEQPHAELDPLAIAQMHAEGQQLASGLHHALARRDPPATAGESHPADDEGRSLLRAGAPALRDDPSLQARVRHIEQAEHDMHALDGMWQREAGPQQPQGEADPRVARLMAKHRIPPGTVAVESAIPLAKAVSRPSGFARVPDPVHPPPLDGSVPLAFLRDTKCAVVENRLIAGFAYDPRLPRDTAPRVAVMAMPTQWLPASEQLLGEAEVLSMDGHQREWLYTQSGQAAIYVGPPLTPPAPSADGPGAQRME